MDSNLIQLKEFTLQGNEIILDMRAREWCKMPYPGHPRGCPNWGKHRWCPPEAPFFDQYFDMGKNFLAVVAEFDMGTYIAGMRLKHPSWTNRQLRNPLYWQNTVRKILAMRLHCLKLNDLNTRVPNNPIRDWTLIPEAMGMHVIATMRPFIPIRARVGDRVFKVGIFGYRWQQ